VFLAFSRDFPAVFLLKRRKIRLLGNLLTQNNPHHAILDQLGPPDRLFVPKKLEFGLVLVVFLLEPQPPASQQLFIFDVYRENPSFDQIFDFLVAEGEVHVLDCLDHLRFYAVGHLSSVEFVENGGEGLDFEADRYRIVLLDDVVLFPVLFDEFRRNRSLAGVALLGSLGRFSAFSV
jgi:hypothetical protein